MGAQHRPCEDRPAKLRPAGATQEMKARLTSARHRVALARCQAVYQELLGAHPDVG